MNPPAAVRDSVGSPATGSDATAASPRRDLRTAAAIAAAVFLVFNANLRVISTGDAYPARYLPFGILRDGSLSLDRLLPNVAQGRADDAFWIVKARGRLISLYPVALPVLVTPLYLPAFGYLQIRGWTVQRLERAARIMEKATASLIAAAAAGLVYLMLRRRSGRRLAAALAVVFALGTSTWVVSSQSLWQHGLGELLAAGSLLLVTGSRSAGRTLAFGALCGLLASNRPPDAILAAALVIAGLFWARRFAPLVLAGAAVPAGLTLAYNLAAAGNVAGAYGLMGHAGFLQHDLLAGLAGLLFSPAKGLFVFSPFLLVIPLSVRTLLRDEAGRGLTIAIAAGAAVQILLYAKTDWRAGTSWGPRFLTDLLPFLFWMLPPIVSALSRAGRAAFVLACAAAIVMEGIGAFWYAGTSDALIYAGGGPHGPVRGAWVPGNAPYVSELRHGPAAADLLTDLQGSLDAVEQKGALVSSVALDAPADFLGWTLIGRGTPSDVEVLVDGVPAGDTHEFFTRPDVVAAIHEESPAGWRVPLSIADIAPGEHLVAVRARCDPDGEFRYVAEQRIEFAARTAREEAPKSPPSLEEAALRAAAAIREHQAAPGYWLTSFTAAPRFERPSPEMNTFLTSMLVDVLGPAAADAGLTPNLARARQHLAAQIEPGGLVRYHGLPDAPTIGSLGCAITPDSDDTALVWRITPGPPGSLHEVLATLREYRTEDGLYRTWLAPRERFQCIDPGRDPNPPDVAIQMHLVLFFSKFEPRAARELCASLGKRIGDESLWVYYQKTPLVPIIRRAELSIAGCPLVLPAEQIRAGVPGQEPWVAASELLARFIGRRKPVPSEAETNAILRTIGDDDFALVRRSPPLVYHNDLSASVSRFYWSEDFGYAVWLRLRFENAHRH